MTNNLITTLLTDRNLTHGDYTETAYITQHLKLVMQTECGAKWLALSPTQRESLEMMAHKIGRILAGDPGFRDHWVDIAGYATLVADRCVS